MIGFVGLGQRSSVEYVSTMHKLWRSRNGGRSSCPVVMISPDFEEVATLQQRDEWDTLDSWMMDWVKKLQMCGAVCVVIGANTMHRSVPLLQDAGGPPVIHIADAVVSRCKKDQLTRVALTGTLFTMRNPLYISRLEAAGIQVFVPDEAESINRIIYDELTKQQVKDESCVEFVRIINAMVERFSIQGVILGCTELPLLLSSGGRAKNLACKVVNTTECHCEAATNYLLQCRPM